MHNVQEHKQVGERQNWLQEKLKDIVVANGKLEHEQARNIENLFPSHVPSLDLWKTWIPTASINTLKKQAVSKTQDFFF